MGYNFVRNREEDVKLRLRKGKLIFYKGKDGVIYLYLNSKNLETTIRQFGINNHWSNGSKHKPFYGKMTFDGQCLRLTFQKSKHHTGNSRVYQYMARIPKYIKLQLINLIVCKSEDYEVEHLYNVEEIWDNNKKTSEEFSPFEIVEFIVHIKPKITIEEQSLEVGKQCTLAVIVKDNQILLQKKSKGLFGEGRWNGAGGKIKPGESARECMIRELKEELKIDVIGTHLVGVLDFSWEEFPNIKPLRVWLYIVDEYFNTPQSSNEGEIKWFKLTEIPYCEMWEDDTYWLPKVINGKKVIGEFIFNKNDKIILYNLQEVISR